MTMTHVYVWHVTRYCTMTMPCMCMCDHDTRICMAGDARGVDEAHVEAD